MRKLLFIYCLMFAGLVKGQSLYFPPLTGTTWDTISPTSLGWCANEIDSLDAFLANTNTKALIVLKDGKIVLENYYGTFTQDSVWYWASASKSLKAFLTGIAQEKGYLSITDTVSDYLGSGWTSATTAQEEAITILHQLTMTTGLDDGVVDPDCTTPACLQYLTTPYTRWAYHNAPYTLLMDVIETATGQLRNQFTNNELKSKTGMDGLWINLGYNDVFFSKARSMARFGLLMLNHGIWANDTIMHDTVYYNSMVNSSQNLNPSYGYLWWLNGKGSYKLPGLQLTFNGDITPNAPSDMYAAMGKNGQLINIVPSLGMIVVRIGDSPNSALVPTIYQNDIWEKLNAAMCNSVSLVENKKTPILVYPNPVESVLNIDLQDNKGFKNLSVYSLVGQKVLNSNTHQNIDVSSLEAGVYIVKIQVDKRQIIYRIIKK